ncbi:putative signal transduction histidine kinase [Variovorax paradoxus B4]|uniref:histidine kinase n=1 Tax=Variovorax paradoxus B4 TaxID=1246301 RepID=T1XJB3_VARPD|nr:ATP-binding protein [Variovorax paradoxus]AGU52982.1 putative signal transduction histidine kinase [Variovorax paradoxus B4]
MATQPVDPAFAVAVGTSAALKKLLEPMQTLFAGCGDPGSETFRLQAQVMRRGDALAAALVAYAQCQKLSPRSLEILPFLRSFANVLWHTLDRRITVTVDVERDGPALFVDAAALEEALVQIVGNAQSAMPHGGRLMLRGALDRHDNRFLNLDVIDSGIGMSPDVAKQAASPFFTTKECSPFSGMGLSAVAGFAAQSGGQMSISSAVGLGTTIRMFLPTVAALATDREGRRHGESVAPRDRKITCNAQAS